MTCKTQPAAHRLSDVWVFGDLRTTRLFEQSLNVLAGGVDLAHDMGASAVMVILLGTASDDAVMVDRQSASDQALACGADQVLILDCTAPASLLPEQSARMLYQAVCRFCPVVCLFPLNVGSREICARVAVLCRAGMIADCMEIRYEQGRVTALSPDSDGRYMYQLGFNRQNSTGFMTVQPHAFHRQRVEHPSTDIQVLEMGEVPVGEAITRRSCVLEAKGQDALEQASRVVAGGAGLGTMEGFARVRQLAAALDAQVGATRPPVVWHWIEEDRLIGQTGKTVSPRLLMSLGISGAVQFTAGIATAGTVVAVNRDPAAPIFESADLGIVGDVQDFLNHFTPIVQQRAMKSLAHAASSASPAGEGTDFGSRLTRMRKAHGLTRESLAETVGRSPEFIQELEQNQTSASVGLMIKLAEVFDVDADTFLSSEDQARLSGQRARAYSRRTANYHYQSLTPGAENEHLRVFMVTIEARRTHKPVAYRHEGEEFIYVMTGKLELTVDGRRHQLMPGESMKFNSELPHQLKNMSHEDTRCLVTLYTP